MSTDINTQNPHQQTLGVEKQIQQQCDKVKKKVPEKRSMEQKRWSELHGTGHRKI